MSDVAAFLYDPEPAGPLLKEGVTKGQAIAWSGEPGPAVSQEVVVLVDGDGVVTWVPTGDPQDVTVVDDGRLGDA